MHVLGKTFISLGHVDEGIAELERAVALREQGPKTRHGVAGDLPAGVGRAHRDAGDLEQALSLYRRAATILDAKGDDALGERVTVHYQIGRTLGPGLALLRG